MAVTRDMLLSELKDLLRLTAFEQTVATVRRAQARTSPIEQELADNATKAGERLDLLRSAVAQVGGTPDVVGPLLGRAGAFLQTQVNQVQTLQGALLGDLALEHQLRERARYARVLAQSLGETSILPVLDRLDVAHSATIDWLETRLAEVGRTGTSALKATPLQVIATGVRRAAGTPLGVLSAGVNVTGGLLARATGRTAQPLQDALQQLEDSARSAVDTARSTAGTAAGVAGDAASTAADVAGTAVDTAADVAGTAVDTAADVAGTAVDTAADVAGTAVDTAADVAGTAVDTAEQAGDTVIDLTQDAAGAVEDAAKAAAERTEEVLEASGGADVEDAKPPFAGYEKLAGDRVMGHVADTDDVDELRTLLAFEQAHKARKGVLKATQERLDALTSA